MLTPTLKTPSDLLKKLLREQHRAFHAEHPSHVADHLYNFCVTALALRDHMFVFRAFDDKAKKQFHQQWAKHQAWVACREIGNTMKHAALSSTQRTLGSDATTTQVASVYRGSNGELVSRLESRPTISVGLSDGTIIDIFELTQTVIGLWRNYFSDQALMHSEQSEAEFFGSSPGEALR